MDSWRSTGRGGGRGRLDFVRGWICVVHVQFLKWGVEGAGVEAWTARKCQDVGKWVLLDSQSGALPLSHFYSCEDFPIVYSDSTRDSVCYIWICYFICRSFHNLAYVVHLNLYERIKEMCILIPNYWLLSRPSRPLLDPSQEKFILYIPATLWWQ
jgi:hypothetical protein